MVENLSSNTPESSSEDDDDSDPKSKSKKKAIGAFAVVAKPSAKVNPKREGLWGFGSNSEEKSDDQPEKIDFFKKLQAPERDSLENVDVLKPGTEQKLDPEEIASAVQQLATARLAEVTPEKELTEQSAEDIAAQNYLEAVAATGNVQEAFEEATVQAASIDPTKISEGEIDLHGSDEEDDPTAASSSKTSHSNPVVRPVPPIVQTGNTSSNQPPPPPTPRYATVQPPPPFRTTPIANTLNAVPQTANNPNVIPVATAAENERRALGNGLIVGGIVGYLYGRRRGRIRTEKRLAPVRKNLEKQVKSLQNELLYNEEVIRAKVRASTVAPESLPAKKIVSEYKPMMEHMAAKKVPEKTPIAKGYAAVESVTKVYESIPHISTPEDIGHVIIAATTAPEKIVLKNSTESFKEISKSESISAKKQAETMSRTELLSLSERVAVDGTTLRQIYETQLVSEKGLRRIVAEHLRGGNVSKALRRELIERQIDFERDPILRDRSHAGGSEGSGKTALGAMLAKAGVVQQEDNQLIGPAINKEKKRKLNKSDDHNKATSKPAIADVSLIALISVLLLIIIVVLMRGY